VNHEARSVSLSGIKRSEVAATEYHAPVAHDKGRTVWVRCRKAAQLHLEKYTVASVVLTLALCASVVAALAFVLAGAHTQSGARRRLVRLAGEIDQIASSLEADLARLGARTDAQELRNRAKGGAARARAALQKPRRLLFLSARGLNAAQQALHDDHGLIVQLRSIADLHVSNKAPRLRAAAMSILGEQALSGQPPSLGLCHRR
jgi:hypothetical protein